MESPLSDQECFLKWTAGLPSVAGFRGNGRDKDGQPLPYGLGPHSVRAVRQACKIAKPLEILEIGFAQGYSSSMFLNLTAANVTAVEISRTGESLEAERLLAERYPGRHRVIRCDSAVALDLVRDRKYDMIFIDGGHLEHHVVADVNLALWLGIPWVFFDDWLPQFGPGVQPVIARSPLEMVYFEGNMALMRPALSEDRRQKLGGSIFVRNAIKYGYCILEALDSLYDICDEVSILECGSDDGTQELLSAWLENRGCDPHKRVVLELNHEWEVAPDYTRLAILANVARERLTSGWHFMLQADEVLHQQAKTAIRSIIARDLGQTYLCRRLNLFGTPDTFVRLDSTKKPCGDAIIRLARTKWPAGGDGEGTLNGGDVSADFVDQIPIFHYGYVRPGAQHIDKAIDMQSWFFGPGSVPDQRIVKMREDGNTFDSKVYFGPDDLSPIPMPHPIYSEHLAERLR